MAKILVLGSVFVDVMLAVEKLPLRGEDVQAKQRKIVIGGCAFNVANTLKALNIEHTFFAPLGTGPYASLVRDQLLKDHRAINVIDPNYDCGYCICLIDPSGERTFLTIQGVEMHYQREWLEMVNFTDYDFMYLCGFELEGQNGPLLLEALQKLKPTARLVIDLGPRGEFIDEALFKDILANLHPIIHCNREELLARVKGINNCEKAALNLIDLGAFAVVTTLDADGAMCIEEDHKITYVPCTKVKPIDSTGAGDSHTGGMMAGLSLGMSLVESVRLGNKVASFMVQQIGSRLTLPKSFSIYNEL